MTNEQLAHELLLDSKFQLDESGGCSVENPVFHRIRESFHQVCVLCCAFRVDVYYDGANPLSLSL